MFMAKEGHSKFIRIHLKNKTNLHNFISHSVLYISEYYVLVGDITVKTVSMEF